MTATATMERCKRVGVLVACLGIAACGQVDSTNQGRDRGPSQSSGSPSFRLERDLAITGGPDDPLGMAGAVATDESGRIYVLDGIAQTIRVFGSDGQPLRNIGRSGEGPGEFAMAVDLAISPDSLLWVADYRARQHLVFDLAGELVRTVPARFQGGGRPKGRPFDRAGRHLEWALGFPNEIPSAASDVVEFFPVALRSDPDPRGAVQWDSMPPIIFRPELAEIEGILRPTVFLAPELVLTLDGRGHIWFADSREYAVYRRTLAGDTVGRLRLDEDPVETTVADREEVERILGGRQREYLDFLPDHKPVIRGLVADGAGRVFVLPETSAVRAGEAIDMFEESGDYLGRLAFPEPLEMPSLGGGVVMHATPDHLYVGGLNAAGIPALWRFRIVEAES